MLYNRFVTWAMKREDGQLYACCPLHIEKTPSFTVNEETLDWYCHGCGEGGGEKEFLVKLLGVDIGVAKAIITAWEGRGEWILPSDEYVEHCHQELLKRPTEITKIHEFGITDEAIKQYKLGWEDTRITFPVFSDNGYCVNVRKYLPPHRRKEGERVAKVTSVRGLGKGRPRFYPYDAFSGDSGLSEDNPIVIVEGEKDCIAARAQGINAITGTGGATLPLQESLMFEGRHVAVMVDTDGVGARLAKDYFTALQPIVASIKRIALPAKDFVDYYQDCIDNDEEIDIFSYAEANLGEYTDQEHDGPAVEMSLTEAEAVENLDTWAKLNNMTIVGVETKVYTVPTKLECICLDSKCDRVCSIAQSALTNQGPVIKVPNRQILHSLNSDDNTQDKFVQDRFRCKKVKAVPKEYTNAQKVIFQESASFVDGLDEASFEHRYGVYISEKDRLTATMRYNLEASRVTDPRTQQVNYVIRDAEPVANCNISQNSEYIEKFRQVAEKSNSAMELLQHHYDEWLPTLAIEGRLDLFGAILLTYCSTTEIEWQNGTIKGWLDTMCIGDTRTGKSQMAQRFVKALELGGYINGENAKRTGVIGGVQQFGGSWVVTWGAIPLNDRGLLIIDEASGLSIDDIKDLSSTRSSGAVTLNKIVKGEARARTRLLWLSNPRSGGVINEFWWKGYGAFQDFIDAVEDQARFDLVLCAAREDIDSPEGVDSTEQPDLEEWRNLVSFAWQVQTSDMLMDKEFVAKVREASKLLNDEMGGGPLIVGVAVHEKLLRLAAAFAVLSGSIVGDQLQLQNVHIDYAVEFLKYILQKESMGYGDYVSDYQLKRKQREENVDYIKALVVTHPTITSILAAKNFKGLQFSEVLGMSKEDSAVILAELIKRRLIAVHSQATYKPEGVLVDIARQFRIGGEYH